MCGGSGAAAAAATVYWTHTMHDARMMWMGSPFAFVAIWTVMMVAMMLPSLVPVLTRAPHPLALATGYFIVWAGFGAGAYLGNRLLVTALSGTPLVARAAPAWTGLVLLALGSVQFTEWKSRHLFCCREAAPEPPRDIRGGWWAGVRLGSHCCRCCTALMALLFVLGMMQLAVIACVAVLIAAERLAPRPLPVVRVVGGLILTVGAVLVLRR